MRLAGGLLCAKAQLPPRVVTTALPKAILTSRCHPSFRSGGLPDHPAMHDAILNTVSWQDCACSKEEWAKALSDLNEMLGVCGAKMLRSGVRGLVA